MSAGTLRPLYADVDESLLQDSLDGVVLNNIAMWHGLTRAELDKRLERRQGEAERDWLARKCAGIWDDVWETPVISQEPCPSQTTTSKVKTPMPASHTPTAPLQTKATARVELVRGDTIEPEAVTWIWNGFLVAHKLNILAGAPGTGKTTLALSIAAAISKGGPLPDGTLAPLGDVLIWSGEDGKGDTLVPRLLACGADISRVHFVGRVRDGNEMRAFNPANDLPELRWAMLESGRTFLLLIVDSVVSAVSGDSHKNAEVRRGLEPLGALAEETGCAILGISHFTKGTQGRDPIERVTGSLAFGAYARLVLATATRDKEHGGGRIFTRAKSNLGPDGGGFVYDLEQVDLPAHPGIIASRVRWGEPLEGTARQILANAEAQSDDGEGGTLDDAKGWLTGMLQDGPKPARTVYKEGREAGHSERTIRRAQKALGVEAVKSAMNGGWVWQLP